MSGTDQKRVLSIRSDCSSRAAITNMCLVARTGSWQQKRELAPQRNCLFVLFFVFYVWFNRFLRLDCSASERERVTESECEPGTEPGLEPYSLGLHLSVNCP